MRKNNILPMQSRRADQTSWRPHSQSCVKRERAREREKERESDSDAVAAEADFEPVGDATKYCWEQDCAYPFDDAGLSARYLDQG